MDDSPACPHGATVLSCIIQNSSGLSKPAPSLIQRLANKLLVVHFPPSSFKGQGSGYDVLLLGEPELESLRVFCRINYYAGKGG